MICAACPRACHTDREYDKPSHGFCKMPYNAVIARAALHMWEEPPNSGEAGSFLFFFNRKFQDMVVELFSYTRKKIDRKSNDIVFFQDGEQLLPYKLSSGEKQMLVILLTVLVRNEEHCVLFMDEPEASLHIEWQQKLIGMIRDLNPNVQLILTTHSPAVIMEGWLDAVTEVEDISTVISV